MDAEGIAYYRRCARFGLDKLEGHNPNLSEAFLRTLDLRKEFQMGEVTVHALQGVDFEVVPGEFVAIMGPSGSGKSTLLHLLAGLEPPSDGSIEFGQQMYSRLSDRDLSLLRRRNIGVIFQFFNLLPNLSAAENVAIPLLLDGRSMRACRQQAEQALGKVGLEGRADHFPDRLSGGEQQRVALARAMVFQPDVLLADEPTGNLDRTSGEQILQILRSAVDEFGQTIVMVTHDAQAASYASRVIFLSDGVIIDEIRDKVITPVLITQTQARLKP